MKKKIVSLSLAAMLSVISSGAVLAVPGDSTNVTAYPNTNNATRSIAGADAYGKATLQSQGNASGYVWEVCPGISTRVVDLSTNSSKQEDSYTIYMKAGCNYTLNISSLSSYAAKGFIRNYN
ncbi:hypothetical protein [Paenibacillus sp. UNC499MF]|uniref:hypothetical protein n=1 Tax=Paenibacillus sp. UNC499MF TaxID=1502751 RepID=UPI0008A06941|nr:hypothetical protein [Paenibacillus sp. UNC499MF]SEG07576.1 hypothetical protein SAMN02799616_01760 [Paenibacillus sp. UNC499MF]